MASPAVTLATILQGKGVVHPTTPAGNIWLVRVGTLLETPANMVALYDTGGFSPNPAFLVDTVTVQARIRGDIDGYASAFTKAQEVKDALLGIDPVRVDDVVVDAITQMGDIIFIGQDSARRPEFTINFRVILERDQNVLTNRDPLEYTGL